LRKCFALRGSNTQVPIEGFCLAFAESVLGGHAFEGCTVDAKIIRNAGVRAEAEIVKARQLGPSGLLAYA
jgi:hypothetical protein